MLYDPLKSEFKFTKVMLDDRDESSLIYFGVVLLLLKYLLIQTKVSRTFTIFMSSQK